MTLSNKIQEIRDAERKVVDTEKKIRYYEDGVSEPYSEDEDQDNWTGYISCDGDEIHSGVIEVYAFDKEMLDKRIKKIVNALNNEETNMTPTSDFPFTNMPRPDDAPPSVDPVLNPSIGEEKGTDPVKSPIPPAILMSLMTCLFPPVR